MNILSLLKENEYISGEEISRLTGVSRAAVWKSINKLKQQGYEIEAVTNKGYCLVSRPDILSSENIKPDTSFIGKSIFYSPVLESTNKIAKQMGHDGAKDGSVFICDKQTNGKGRMGKVWETDNDALSMSVLLRPDIIPSKVIPITLIAGLAVTEAIDNIYNINTKLKWPNDVILNNKKICGILTEMSAETDLINFLVVGIGVNVNSQNFAPELSDKATSLLIETGQYKKR